MALMLIGDDKNMHIYIVFSLQQTCRMRKRSRIYIEEPTTSKYKTSFLNKSYLQPKQRYQSIPMRKNRESVPDSLDLFQSQIERSLLMSKDLLPVKKNRLKGRKIYTEPFENEEEQKSSQKLSELQNEVSGLKVELLMSQQAEVYGDRLDRLMEQMSRVQDLKRQNVQQNSPYPKNPSVPQARRMSKGTSKSFFQNKSTQNKGKYRLRRTLRKHFFAVLFPIFLRSESYKLAQRRRNNLKIFFQEKFNSQILNIKNWLVEGLSFSIPVILQKQKLSLNFWDEKRQTVTKQKQKLLLQIVQIGLSKIHQGCVQQKTSLFAQLLHNLCSNGSFPKHKFWSAMQMKHICISEYLGFIRAEESLQKFMLTQVVFVKMLIFNMLLQPHKFDSASFPRKKQPLVTNMYIIASVYYRLAKQIIEQYLYKPREDYYRLSNWLKLKEQFIVECCQPLRFHVDYPEQNQWITGMLGQQLELLELSSEWDILLGKMRLIVEFLHKEMKKRRKDVVRFQKYKLYQ